MKQFIQYVRALVRNEQGQDLVEYAMLVALIALGAAAAVGFAGDQVEIIFNEIVEALPLPE